jgi:hypothetical protein
LAEIGSSESIVATGTGVELASNRWGDYSSMSIDPTDDCTFRYSQEYFESPYGIDWVSHVVSFKFDSCN